MTPIIRLMQHAGVSRDLFRRMGPEDQMACQFAADLRVASIEGRLDAVWFHPASELAYGHKTGASAAKARTLGMHKGIYDYVFLWGTGAAALEAKSDVGRQTDGQKDFAHWCAAHGVQHSVFRSVPEGLGLLKGWGIYRD